MRRSTSCAVWPVSEPVQVVDLGLDGVYPTLQVWSDGMLRWLCTDGETWHEERCAGVPMALTRAAELAPLVTAALDSSRRLDDLHGADR